MRIPDPVGVARAWRQYGFHHLHVVDLDGVAGRGQNTAEIQAILAATDAEVQIGGGIRSQASIDQMLNDGAQRVVIGTRALEDPDWLIDMSMAYPGCIVVAAGSLRDAIETAWRKGINPGGEAVGFEVPPQYEHVIAERNWADRLLSRAELNDFGEFSEYDRTRHN